MKNDTPKLNYRINGFDQLKAFWEGWIPNNADKSVKPYHITLYLYLIHLNNRLGWVEWFPFDWSVAMMFTKIGNRGTYYKAMQDLHDFGLIKYKQGINKLQLPQVSIIQLSKNGHLLVHLLDNVLDNVLVHQLDTLYITSNDKLITLNSRELFFDSNQSVRLQLIQILQNLKDEDVQFTTENHITASTPNSGSPPPPLDLREAPTCEQFYEENFERMRDELAEQGSDKYPYEKQLIVATLLLYSTMKKYQGRQYNYEDQTLFEWKQNLIDLMNRYKSDIPEVLRVVNYYLTEETYTTGKIYNLKQLVSHYHNLRAEMNKAYEHSKI